PLVAVIINGNEKKVVALISVNIGDIVEINAGDKVPVDGKVISGNGSFDVSTITGVSVPVYKKDGDAVLSGTINLDS
ncbi:heavy metal translocating P-type ATPase, partial [Aliarcobacter butzleri]